jgi:hypothetical protein
MARRPRSAKEARARIVKAQICQRKPRQGLPCRLRHASGRKNSIQWELTAIIMNDFNGVLIAKLRA